MVSDVNPDPILVSETILQEIPERNLPGRYQAKRTEGEKLRDLEEISSLYFRGIKADEIAKTIAAQHGYAGLTAVQIRKDLQQLRQMWVQSALINYDAAKAREIAHVDELEAAAWEAWGRSWGKATTEIREAIEDRYGKKDEETSDKKPTTYARKRATSTSKDLVGDPRYLDIIARCIDRRCKILGLDEPTRLAISWQDEATKAGITIEDAQAMYKQMVGMFTSELRNKYLKENSVEIPQELIEGEFEDISSDGDADIDSDD